MDSKYQEALNLYNQCDYEGAYAIIIENGLCSTEKGDFLCNECRKQILQQYIYLIKDYIEQEMYGEAIGLRQYYYTQYGFSSELSGINIPEPVLPVEAEETHVAELEVVEKKTKENTIVEKSSLLKRNMMPLICIVALLIGLGGYLIYYYNFNEEYIINKKIETLKQDVTKQILLIDLGHAFYIQKGEKFLYNLDILNNHLEKIPLETVNKDGDYEAYIYSLREAFAINNNEIIFIGDNGGISAFGGDNVLKYDITRKKLKEICSGRSVKHQNGKLIVTHFTLVKEGSCMAENEYFYYDVYCDYDGNVIDGYNILGKGKIDKYSIDMFFHCLEGNITGWYKYNGHDNYMNLKGKVKADNQFFFTEYDEKGNSFATFIGEADFVNQVLNGYFKYHDNQLEFLIYNDLDPRSCINVWNYIHNPSLSNCVYLNSLYGKFVDFYGARFTSTQCLEHFLPIKSYTQKIVNDIKYTSIDNNTIRCDFIKGIDYKGQYREFEAYLILNRKNEYSPWKIIVESDKTTDDNLKLKN